MTADPIITPCSKCGVGYALRVDNPESWRCSVCLDPIARRADCTRPKRCTRFSFRDRIPPIGRLVGRPSKWGNPFRIEGEQGAWTVTEPDDAPPIPAGTPETFEKYGAAAAHAVSRYEAWLTQTEAGREIARQARTQLRGFDLYCYCAKGASCHGDVLLATANEVIDA